jgi:transcriptional regulator with XRE-family HTH domain
MPSEKGFFALRLKELREKADLSQPELAERCRLAVGTIRQFEQGRREPTYATLVKLAEGLGVSLSAFEPAKKTEPTPPPASSPPEAPKGKGRARKPKDK